MSKLFIASICVLVFCVTTFAQVNEASPCPTISIKTSADTIQPGEVITFTANFENKDLGKLIYDWTVSIGTIIEGRGTPSINVITTPDLQRQNVTATVEIKGLPTGCSNTFREQAAISELSIPGCGLISALDEYGKLSVQDEKAILESAAFQINENPNSIALFIIGIRRAETYSSIKKRVDFISNYLTTNQRIPRERLKFLYSADESRRTTIYALLPNVVDSFLIGTEGTENLESLRPQNKSTKSLKQS